MEHKEVKRGEVFYADLSPVVGSEQGGVRPVLIVQNDVGNRHSPTVIAAAITSKQDKTNLPTHIGIKAGTGGLTRDSVVLLEQVRTLDKRRLRERAGQIDPDVRGAGNQLRAGDVLGQHRTIHGCRLKCRPACIFSGSCHKKPREYTKYSLRFLFKLPKNLPAQFST